MDVDRQILSDPSPILESIANIAAHMGRTPTKDGIALQPRTRVIMIHPTAKADAFLGFWEAICHLEVDPVENNERGCRRLDYN